MFEIILKEDYEDHYMFREIEKADIEAKNRAEFMSQINLKGRKTPRKTKKKTQKQKKRTLTMPSASEWPEAVQLDKLNFTTKDRNMKTQKIVDNPSGRESY